MPAHLRVTHGMRLSIRVRAHHGRPTPPRLADARAAGSTSRAADPVQATRTPELLVALALAIPITVFLSRLLRSIFSRGDHAV